ncbi:hypothetical protein TELCIR_10665 [Teladorsagia circumcincta]|uniref:Uncharacterized protein n=1 Tax=Teladorsagia circumcincta TaxID=45464 RepID=A0A2G9UBG2_TELCI|nr:hypothetical protein TELCIR_10665 [Teladorsagia circumcincta]
MWLLLLLVVPSLQHKGLDLRPPCNLTVDMGDANCEKNATIKTILFGKSCDHQFCPDGAECHRGAYFAYCCQ